MTAPRRRLVALGAVAVLLAAACGDDDDASADQRANSETPTSEGQRGDDAQSSRDASGELTIDGQTYSFEPYTGCTGSDETTVFVGHGAGPDGTDAELSVSIHEDPPGSDLPGGNWTLTEIAPGDTPGLADGDELLTAEPGLLRSEDDGFDITVDGSTLRITGPGEGSIADTPIDTDVVVTCG